MSYYGNAPSSGDDRRGAANWCQQAYCSKIAEECEGMSIPDLREWAWAARQCGRTWKAAAIEGYLAFRYDQVHRAVFGGDQ